MFQQTRAGIGQHHTPAITLEQILPQLYFELAHLTAERRLNHR